MSMSKYASRADWAEAMGYECGRHGATEANCHFSIFSEPTYTRAWELGKKRGDTDRERTIVRESAAQGPQGSKDG